MSERRLSEEFFENQQEQSRIKIALTDAIPENVYYHNLIVALAELLARATHDAFKEEVFTKSMKDKMKSEDAP